MVLTVVTALCCSNSDENLNDNQLIGNWNWKSSTGGIAGVTITPESTGNVSDSS